MNKINYLKISAEELWQNLSLYSENLAFENGLRINKTDTYIFKDFIIKDPDINIADLDIDECDALWIIDRNKKRVIYYNRYSNELKEIGCKKGLLPVKLNSPTGIGIDIDTIYIADYDNENKNSSIIALARSNLQIRWICNSDDKGNLLGEIIDLTVGADRCIYVLEKNNKQVLRIERSGNINIFIKSSQLAQPTDITVDNNGFVYILDNSKIFIFNRNGTSYIIQTLIDLKGISVSKKKQIFAGESGKVDSKKTIFKIMHDGTIIPIWSYRGPVRKLINDSKGNLYVIDIEGKSIAFLEYTTINAKDKENNFKGIFISKLIDSTDEKNKWHRFLIEGEFIKGTQVEFSYFISSSLLSDAEIIALPEEKWKKCFVDSSDIQGQYKRDALFLDDMQARYLWFKISLYGDEKISPIIKSITLFFPRLTWINHLPSIFQENPESKYFFERFLSIFESLTFEIDFEIKHLTRFLDAEGTPSEFLSWLGTWVSFCVDSNLPENKTRTFINNAVYFYKMRGTRKGLEEVIKLFTGYKPYIVENIQISTFFNSKCIDKTKTCFSTECIFLPSEISKVTTTDEENISLTQALYGSEKFCFCVLLHPSSLGNYKIETIKRIVDVQKPAHTCYGLKILEPWFYLDTHTYLGINTFLTEPVFILGKSSVIGRDTKIQDIENAGQIIRKGRMGIDTKLT